VIEDVVRERVSLGAAMVEDFVILDEGSAPTYDFAAVLDDSAMGITDVLRGEDRLPNTLRQVLLYSAMGLRQPRFGHLPLIVGPAGERLEGRDGLPEVGWFREKGFLPEALVNETCCGSSTRGPSARSASPSISRSSRG